MLHCCVVKQNKKSDTGAFRQQLPYKSVCVCFRCWRVWWTRMKSTLCCARPMPSQTLSPSGHSSETSFPPRPKVHQTFFSFFLTDLFFFSEIVELMTVLPCPASRLGSSYTANCILGSPSNVELETYP